MSLKFTARAFDKLTVHEVHDALRLRTDIFVVEQACAYPEVDGRDPECTHILGKNDQGELIAYARIIPPEKDHPPHSGRVVVRMDQRGKGHARELMQFSLKTLKKTYGSKRSALAAQSHLEKFYADLGYLRQGPDYPWDGIPHVDMLLE